MTCPNVNTKVRSSIPIGVKENVHFVLKSYNEGKYEIEAKFIHPSDDKGVISIDTITTFRSTSSKETMSFAPFD